MFIEFHLLFCSQNFSIKHCVLFIENIFNMATLAIMPVIVISKIFSINKAQSAIFVLKFLEKNY